MAKDPNTKATKATTAAATGSKDGHATNPQDTVGKAAGKSTHTIATGHRLSIGSKTREEGYGVSAADFATASDPDGSVGLQRLVDSGAVLAGSKAGDKAEGDRAGGGVIERGGATGAGPSAAQIIAADAGDEGSQAVVAAALGGTEAEFTAAATDGASEG